MHDLARPVLAVGRHDRGPAGHGLHQDGSKALPPGRQDERRRARDPGPRILHESGHDHSRADAQLARQRFEAPSFGALAENDQGQIGVRQAGESMQQQIEPFLPMQPAARREETGGEASAIRLVRESADPSDLDRVVNDSHAVA